MRKPAGYWSIPLRCPMIPPFPSTPTKTPRISFPMGKHSKGFGEYLGIDCQLNAASSSCPFEFSSKDKKIRYALYGDGVTDMRIILF